VTFSLLVDAKSALGTFQTRQHAARPGVIPARWAGLLLSAFFSFGAAFAEDLASLGRIVHQYALTSAYSREYADPRNWQLLGSNDNGTNWVVLDAQTNQIFRSRSERRVFAITNQTAFSTYRLRLNQPPGVHLAELELLGADTGLPPGREMQMRITSTRDQPLIGPAADAFDKDPTTRWIDYGVGASCWLQCQFTFDARAEVTSISDFLVQDRRLAARNPLQEKAPEVLAQLKAQGNRPMRTLTGYALTSANDVPERDPRDWRLLGSNDGGQTWQMLDERRNESFSTRFHRRAFSLKAPATCAIYRLAIDSVRAPAAATCVQLAELEPIYAAPGATNNFSIIVSAQGENPPMEVADALFDHEAKSKWLDFAGATERGEAGANLNRSSWVQWQYLPDLRVPVVNLHWLQSVQSHSAEHLFLNLRAVAVSWDSENGIVGLVDESGFQKFRLDRTGFDIKAGERVHVSGRLRLGQQLPQLLDAEVLHLGLVNQASTLKPGAHTPIGDEFALGAIEGEVSSISADQLHVGFEFKDVDGPGLMKARIVNQLSQPFNVFAGCRLWVTGVVQSVFNQSGERIAGLIWIPDAQYLSVSRPAPQKWEQWPAIQWTTLASGGASTHVGEPARLTGRLGSNGAQFLLSDGTNELLLSPLSSDSCSVGADVEVVGFLSRESDKWWLHMAHLRPAIAIPAPPVETSKKNQKRESITSLAEAFELGHREPSNSFPVRVRGVITYVDLELGGFYLQNGADALYVIGSLNAGVSPSLQQEGLYVEVTGEYVPADQNISVGPFIKVLGRGQMPDAPLHSVDYLMTGKDFSHWVQIEGVVRDAGEHRLVLAAAGGKLVVWINQIDNRAARALLGNTVRISGVCSAVVNNRNMITGIRLLTPSLEHVQVIKAFPDNPFAMRATPLADVASLGSDSGNQPFQLIKTEGILTYKSPHSLFVQQGNEGLRVIPRSDTEAVPGDRVEVVGFQEPDGFSPKLVQASVRKLQRAELPAANAIDLLETDLSSQDATRAELEAIVLGSGWQDSLQTLQLKEEKRGRTFSAFFPTNSGTLPPMAVGTRIRLQGVLKAEPDALPDYAQVMNSFALYGNSPNDVVILQRPPWWGAREALWLLSGVCGLLLLALAWAALLRRQVRQQTQELAYERDLLRTLLDTATDYIYFKDRSSRFVACSRSLAVRCGMQDQAQLLGKTDFDFFAAEHARNAFADEQEIVATGQPLVGKVEKEVWPKGRKSSWVLTTKMPLRDKSGQIIGTFGISKDISELKEAEMKLEEVHKQLMETSRQAGMAEVATSVLHNVGNVLNSLNVSANLLVERSRKSSVRNLMDAVRLMREHPADLPDFLANDERGKQLPGYFEKVAEHLVAEQAAALDELRQLTANVDHIKDIVSVQQSYARIAGVAEPTQVTELVEDALRMNAGALARHDVELVREFSPHLPTITVERHKVLQILVNLVRNAKYACDEAGREDKRMIVRIYNGNGRIKIAVSDNGVGIPRENLTRIFNHGFTTRKDGHGFALHSGALAARELGGSLQAQSDGPGLGATFTLELPMTPVSADTNNGKN
jgi:PAS domain S-box-containing protein